MDKEKQIEEMAKIMCNCYDSGNCKMHGNLCDLKCISGFNALGLYNAGYRKAYDVIDEFAERLKCTLIVNNEENTFIFDYDFTLETIDQIANYMKGEGK